MSVFRIIYPLIYSVVPLILYSAFEPHIGKKQAFLAVFLFMSYMAYYAELPSVAREQIAEVLMALFVLLLLNHRLRAPAEKVVTVALTFGLLISHYSTAYIVMFFVAVSWVILRFRREVTPMPNLPLLFVFFALVWYVYGSSTVSLGSLAGFGAAVYQGISTQFFSPTTRPPTVQGAFGVGWLPGPIHDLNILVEYSIQFFIVVGVLWLWKNRKSRVLGDTFLLFTLMALVTLVLSIVLPFFAAALNISRWYHLTLVFLAPACIVGGATVFKWIARAIRGLSGVLPTLHVPRPSRHDLRFILVSAVIVMYFLFNVGFMWEITGAQPTSVSLSFNRMRYSDIQSLMSGFYASYTPSEDVASTRWMSTYVSNSSRVCADLTARNNVFESYGLIPTPGPVLYPTPDGQVSCTNPYRLYTYISYFNGVEHIGTGPDYAIQTWNFNVSYLLVDQNTVYSNGAGFILATPQDS